jgi:hypothetical protein
MKRPKYQSISILANQSSHLELLLQNEIKGFANHATQLGYYFAHHAFKLGTLPKSHPSKLATCKKSHICFQDRILCLSG